MKLTVHANGSATLRGNLDELSLLVFACSRDLSEHADEDEHEDLKTFLLQAAENLSCEAAKSRHRRDSWNMAQKVDERVRRLLGP